MEKWVNIKGYEGNYSISNLGRVKSNERRRIDSIGRNQYVKEKILSNVLNNNKGYKTVALYLDNKRKTTVVHVLVAIHFLNHIPNGKIIVVDHIDNDKHNNKYNNLQLITTRENNSKDRKNGSSKYTGVTFHKRDNTWQANININGKPTYLGRYNNELEAKKKYDEKLKMLIS